MMNIENDVIDLVHCRLNVTDIDVRDQDHDHDLVMVIIVTITTVDIDTVENVRELDHVHVPDIEPVHRKSTIDCCKMKKKKNELN